MSSVDETFEPEPVLAQGKGLEFKVIFWRQLLESSLCVMVDDAYDACHLAYDDMGRHEEILIEFSESSPRISAYAQRPGIITMHQVDYLLQVIPLVLRETLHGERCEHFRDVLEEYYRSQIN